MSATTVNSCINKLSALMKWAENEGYIDQNPARGLRVVDPIRKKDKRHPFSTNQLGRIFRARIYGPDHPHRGKFWGPLIGLFSGMRLNEICQLDTADVRLIDDVLCFIVTIEGHLGSSTAKRLKTPNAERIVPVHPKLIEIGFCQYLDTRRGQPGTKLFPDLSVASTGYFSDNFSKSFSYSLKKCGIKTARTSFHSFRHNFRDALRDARVDRDLAYALGGWAGENGDDSSGVAEQYGRGYNAKTLDAAMRSVSYRGLSLDHLIMQATTSETKT
jgi:integrase